MGVIIGFAAGGTLGLLAVLINAGQAWLNSRRDLRLRELDVRALEAKARIVESQRKAEDAKSPN